MKKVMLFWTSFENAHDDSDKLTRLVNADWEIKQVTATGDADGDETMWALIVLEKETDDLDM